MFYKSCFYVTRDLIYYRLKILCLSYNEIYKRSKDMEIPEEYRKILYNAFMLRNEESIDIDSKMYFKNISYINNTY